MKGIISRYRGWEHWNTFLFESPAHLRLGAKLLKARMNPLELCKVNWALDHGGFAFASKLAIQGMFPLDNFPATTYVDSTDPIESNRSRIETLQARLQAPFPLIFKPDNGRVGRGVVRVRTVEELNAVMGAVEGRYVVQEYCSLPFEAGVFFYRQAGKAGIFTITIKEFPHVVGDGTRSTRALVADDTRLRRYIPLLSKQCDGDYVPKLGETVLLSYVGNHAQGTVFRTGHGEHGDTVLKRVLEILGDHPGFNYGRLDVRAKTEAAFWSGDFLALEVNGVDSLATNIFDPSWSIFDAYRQLFRQYDLLVKIATEQSSKDMKILPIRELYKKTIESEKLLLRNHTRVIELGLR